MGYCAGFMLSYSLFYLYIPLDTTLILYMREQQINIFINKTTHLTASYYKPQINRFIEKQSMFMNFWNENFHNMQCFPPMM